MSAAMQQNPNVVISDKMQYPTTNGVTGGGGQWFVDERDGFISWLRGEFAAANAIIDSLCHHARSIGEPGEYDVVMTCVQQRRCNWNHVLHMQQYFSISEVTFALQQAAWKKQQRTFDKVRFSDTNVATRHWFPVGSKENQTSGCEEQRSVGEDNSSLEKEGVVGSENSQANVSLMSAGNLEATMFENKKAEVVKDESTTNLNGSCNALVKTGSDSLKKQDEQQNLVSIPKIFIGTEILDGKAVNVVEGLKLYGELFDSFKISSIVQLANELRSAGRRGHLKGRTFIASKRPMKGRGRDVIQLGVPIVDAPQEDGKISGNSEDGKVEAIPNLLQDVIERLVSLQITMTKSDSCIIDFFNEGDHSQPHSCPHSFGRPICILVLTECDMTFGRIVGAVHPGEYRGSLKLSLLPGSLLSMQGKSADFAKHAISSIRKQRILVTFINSQPKKVILTDGPHFPPSIAAQPTPWGPPPARPPSQSNHVRHPVGPKHFGAAATTGVLPIPPIHQQHLPPPNSMKPLFIASPVPPAMPHPTSVPLPPESSGWTAVATPRHPPPRLPLPGTGVFLPPPGSGPQVSPQHTVSSSVIAVNFTIETLTPSDDGKVPVRLNCNGVASPKSDYYGNTTTQECNGSIRTDLGRTVAGEQKLDDLENGASKTMVIVKVK